MKLFHKLYHVLKKNELNFSLPHVKITMHTRTCGVTLSPVKKIGLYCFAASETEKILLEMPEICIAGVLVWG